jgi:SAM-dependent methyltransferase
MLKMYRESATHGGSPTHWAGNWAPDSFHSAVRFCDVDPLRPLIGSYVHEGSVMLEGGCGLGQWVAYYSARGAKVVGLDFSFELLRLLRSRGSDLKLCAGDVAALPFADQSFDVYYSGGVVEHFEEGAGAALLEARRVLRSDGVLLISVPYFSPLRHLLLPTKRSVWKTLTQPRADTPRSNSPLKFFQYAYTRTAFEAMLTSAGFDVRSSHPLEVMWGLWDVPVLGRALLGRGARKTARHVSDSTQPELRDPQVGDRTQRSLAKRLIVSEDTSTPVLGGLVSFLRWGMANMMVFVCSPRGPS